MVFLLTHHRLKIIFNKFILLEQICKYPHRRIGTNYAHEIEDFLFAKFKEFGLETVKKERLDLIDWSVTNWKLIIQKGNEPIEIPCFYVLNTGFTDKNGKVISRKLKFWTTKIAILIYHLKKTTHIFLCL